MLPSTASAASGVVEAPANGYYGVTTIDTAQHARADTRADADAEVAACPIGQWTITRFTTCFNAGLTYTARDKNTHAPVGGAQFTITQNAELNPQGTQWTENLSLTMVAGSAWGVVLVTPMQASWQGSCSGAGCQVPDNTAFPPSSSITQGATLSGTMTFSNPRAKGTVEAFQTTYLLHVVSVGSLADAPAHYGSPELRCDAQVGSTSGCVVTGYIPTFNVDSVEFPLAALGVRWAQDNLASHPGKPGAGAPLNRQANTAKQQANRARICGSSSGFVKLPTVPDDSCDEYPFAATTQGGSMQGPDCAEIVPLPNGSVQVIKPASAITTCARAHVPLGQNTDVGGDLGQWVQGQRVIDNEQYWVSTV
ncbi:NucA/NucB deoxyribonuclease domain-containing protein [Amycolatopsis lurida]